MTGRDDCGTCINGVSCWSWKCSSMHLSEVDFAQISFRFQTCLRVEMLWAGASQVKTKKGRSGMDLTCLRIKHVHEVRDDANPEL